MRKYKNVLYKNFLCYYYLNVSINNTLQKLILQQIIINKLLKIVEKFLFRQSIVRKKLLKKHS